MSRVTRFKDLVIKAGAKARTAKSVGGSLNGSIQLTTIFENMTEATKSFEAYSKDPEMISLMKEREDNPAATLIGPEIYKVFMVLLPQIIMSSYSENMK